MKDLKNVSVFFARKFDPLHNNLMINYVDQSMYGLYPANFKSLFSFWQNVFHSEEPTEAKYKNLFKILSKISLHKLEELASMAQVNLNLIGKEHFLTSVEAFFEADVFNGYVLNFKTNKDFIFETFFKKKSLKNLIKLFRLQETSNPILNEMRDNFLQSLIKIQVSTDFEQKERHFSNYANIMDIDDNPLVSMEFDPINQPIEFCIKWIDPLGNLAKEKKVKINSSKKNQVMVHSFQKSEDFSQLKSTGEWKLDIYIQNVSEYLVLSVKFLILPKFIENYSVWISLVENFWQFESFCFNKIESTINFNDSILKRHIFKECAESSYWSSYYPDPKSDIFSNLQINLSDRIF